jgi:hypothetical protein
VTAHDLALFVVVVSLPFVTVAAALLLFGK